MTTRRQLRNAVAGMRSPASWLVLTILLPFTLGCSALRCSGYTYVQAGVESNFLIDDGRVLFAQAGALYWRGSSGTTSKIANA